MAIFSDIFNFFNGKREYSLKINTFSNFFGNAWSALISLIFVPINLHYLGIEAYGIIGIFNSLQAFVWLFDFGLSGVISRELPQIAALPEKLQEILDLTRTANRINWLMGIIVSLILVSVSPLIANYWLQGNQLSQATVSQALMIMSGGFIMQWTLGFYSNGLAALQKQALLNLINISCNTARSIGGVLVLIFISSTIQAFLIWQIVIGIIQLFLAAIAFNKCLPKGSSITQFRWNLLKSRFGFASGLTIMSVLALVLHELDKIILSRLLTLEFFGYYTLATTITTLGLGMIPRSISNAVYPRFSYFVSSDDEGNLSSLYHRSTQVMSVLMLPITAVLVAYPYEILNLWTRNADIASNTWILLSILAIATALNGFLNIPFYIQLAHGWTRIVITTAIITLFTVTPIMILTVRQYGAIAGAMNWLLLNVFQIIISVSAMHRYTLLGEQWRWYFVDILKPFVIALTTAFLCRAIFSYNESKVIMLLTLSVTTIITYAFTGLSVEFTRNWLLGTYKTYLGGKLLR